MSNPAAQKNAGKTNPWLGFALLAPLTLLLFALSSTDLEGSLRTVAIVGIALVQSVIAARFLLGVHELHTWLKALLLLIVVATFLMLFMPTLQLFEGPAFPASQWDETIPEVTTETEAP